MQDISQLKTAFYGKKDLHVNGKRIAYPVLVTHVPNSPYIMVKMLTAENDKALTLTRISDIYTYYTQDEINNFNSLVAAR